MIHYTQTLIADEMVPSHAFVGYKHKFDLIHAMKQEKHNAHFPGNVLDHEYATKKLVFFRHEQIMITTTCH